jgi:hypothetical protein
VWGGVLFGRHYLGSLWYYLPAAPLVKTPLGALALWLAGAAVMLAVPRLVFVPMFLAVAAAGVVTIRRRWVNVAAVVLVAFAAVGSLRTFPYRLRQRYAGERIWLVYKGLGLPSYYGIDAADPLTVPADQVRGLLVVSDSEIAGADDRLAALIASSTPIDEVGHSITIYRRP